MKIKRLFILILSFVIVMTSSAFAKSIDNNINLKCRLNIQQDLNKLLLERVRLFLGEEEQCKIKYNLLDNKLPENVEKWVDENKKLKKTCEIKKIDNKNYVYVMQQTPSSGYQIKIQDIQSTNDVLLVKYQAELINKNSVNLQVISYPYTVFEIENNKDYKKIIAKNTINPVNVSPIVDKEAVNYKLVENKNFTEEIKKWVNENKKSKKMQGIKKIDDKTYVYIMQEVSTSGYNIQVEDLYSVGENLFINYQAKLFDKNICVLDVISYPYAVLEIDSNKDYKKIYSSTKCFFSNIKDSKLIDVIDKVNNRK